MSSELVSTWAFREPFPAAAIKSQRCLEDNRLAYTWLPNITKDRRPPTYVGEVGVVRRGSVVCELVGEGAVPGRPALPLLQIRVAELHLEDRQVEEQRSTAVEGLGYCHQ
jgi:hypothetical protein